MDFGLGKKIIENISDVVVGKSKALELLVVVLLANGHALIEDVPGVGKTLIAKSLAMSFQGIFKRIQFTPDLLPSDITGFNVFDQQSHELIFHSGPVMANILLADEINRAIPRTQSSLLESMEERQVTVDGKTYGLPDPFCVLATQNPIELEGTFPLPEAQLDRFLLRIQLGYPDKQEEISILDRFQKEDPLINLDAVATPAHLIELQKARKQITISTPVKEYIADIVTATRENSSLRFGASPRGSLGLMRASQGLAALRGREYVLPDDIKYLALPVLAHRVILNDENRLRGESTKDILEEIIDRISVPA